jgi:uncharacterized protein YdhG (YjbR/CyaY superfamily)
MEATLIANEYLAQQPDERREALTKIREVFLHHLPEGFEETMQYNMLSYVVPFSIYPAGYHCNPKDRLPFISIANQKGAISIYHMGLYSMPEHLAWFQEAYAAAGVGKLDMGKSCIRFKKMDKIPYALLEELAQRISVQDWISCYESVLKR